MANCPKCNKEFSEGTKFCDSCGAQIFQTVFCPNCGEKTSTEFAFCQNCGTSLAARPTAEQAAPVVTETPAVAETPTTAEAPVMTETPAVAETPTMAEAPVTTEAPAKKKKSPVKAIIFSLIGVALIAAIVAAAIFVLPKFLGHGGKGKENYALYLKDGELFVSDLKKGKEGFQLTSNVFKDREFENQYLSELCHFLSYSTYVSEDGKYIFFTDKTNEDGDGLNLYYKEISKPDSEAIKIGSDITNYFVNPSATVVTYTKGEEDRNLYQFNIREDSNEKIVSGVYSWWVSDDGKKLYYTNSEDNLYYKNADKDKEKLAGDVDYILYVNEDFSTVYYMKEGSLYKQILGDDKEKIASDVLDVINIYESGEIYYTKEESDDISLIDYVIDDMKDADASVTWPEYPDYPDSPTYPYWFEYDTDAEYEAAYEIYEEEYYEWVEECNRIDEEYEAAKDEYWAKDLRDELRESLKEATLNSSSYSLYFYDGKEEVLITDASDEGYSYDYTYSYETPVIVYKAYNQSTPEKVKLSEVEYIYELREKVEEALFSSSEAYIAVYDESSLIKQEKEAKRFYINETGTVAYYFDNVSDNDHGDLYSIIISDGVAEEPEVYDTDVYLYNFHCIGTKCRYFKNYEDGSGEMYINKDKIDDDVSSRYIYFDSEKVIYITDWNEDKEYGTLKVYDGKDPEEIAEEVHELDAVSGDRVVYLYDYSLKSYKGELYEWSDGKNKKIDEDVAGIILSYGYNGGFINY